MRSLLVIAVVLTASPAAADMIRMPRECPEGWEGRRFGHGGHCYPVECETDADCEGGASCEVVSRCWNRRPEPRGRSRTVTYGWVPLEARCEQAECEAEQECRRGRECVPGEGGGEATSEGETPDEVETEVEEGVSTPPAREPTAVPEAEEAPATHTEGGGCGSCASTRGRAPVRLAALFVAGLGLLWWLRRR